MERDQNTIIFNDKEQTEFGLQPVVSVLSALNTADVFSQTADKLITKIETPADSSNYQQVIEWRNAEARAVRLMGVAGRIMMLCPTEVIDQVIKNSQIRPV